MRSWAWGALAVAVLVLGAAGIVPAWPGLPHLVAVPPLDLFADVRLLYGRAPSWPVFVLGTALSLAVRSAVLALVLGAPGRALRVYGLALLPALVAGGLQFAGLAVAYHWLFWAGVALTIVTFLALGPTPAVGVAGRVVYLIALAALGAFATLAGQATALAGVVPSGVLTLAVLSRGLPRTRPFTVAAGTVVLAVAATIWVVTDRVPAGPPAEPAAGSLLLVAGHGTASGRGTLFHLDPADLGYRCEQTSYFSYAGTGRGARQRDAVCAIRTGRPYGREDTRRPLDALAQAFREQVESLDPPVLVVAHSQGGWIAWRALADAGHPLGVAALVVLGPLPTTSTAWLPPGKDTLDAVLAFARARHWTTFRPDDPLPREMFGTRNALERLFAARLPDGVRALTVSSMLDLPVLPEGRVIPGVPDTCPMPVTHSGLVQSSDAMSRIRRFLAGAPLGQCPGWTTLPGRLLEPFGVPAS